MSPGAVLAIAVGPETRAACGTTSYGEVTGRYSAIQNWENADLIALLEERRVFKRLGEKKLAAEPYDGRSITTSMAYMPRQASPRSHGRRARARLRRGGTRARRAARDQWRTRSRGVSRGDVGEPLPA